MALIDIILLFAGFITVFALIGIFFWSVANGKFEDMVFAIVDFFDRFEK